MTAILAYTPMVKAEVAVRQQDGSVRAYDLTDDITGFKINLNVDSCSTFSLSLQNKGGKYNGAFTPMDRIVIRLSKGDEYPVFAGYITKCDFWRLYNADFEMSGKCALYRLQALYWDAGLYESQQLLFTNSSTWKTHEEYWRVGANVLTNVANWDASKIAIGQLPDDVIEFATSMYRVKLADTQGADMVNQIYKMLQTSGPAIGSGGSSSAGGGTASYEAVEKAVQWAIQICNDDSHGYSQGNRDGNPDYDCSSLVFYSLLAGGWTREELGSWTFNTTRMQEVLPPIGWKMYPYDGNVGSLKRGDIMWRAAHTEWYIGNGETAGAHSAEDGGIYGQGGDQTGDEISVVKISGSWTHFFRYEKAA
jgi:hypothetical protein